MSLKQYKSVMTPVVILQTEQHLLTSLKHVRCTVLQGITIRVISANLVVRYLYCNIKTVLQEDNVLLNAQNHMLTRHLFVKRHAMQSISKN